MQGWRKINEREQPPPTLMPRGKLRRLRNAACFFCDFWLVFSFLARRKKTLDGDNITLP
jgi:hypothetical protein